jgi:hypothetical protein
MENTKQKPKKLTLRQRKFLQAYKATMGNVTKACEMTGVKSRRSYYDWLENEEFAKEIELLQETQVDFAESMLFKNMSEGKETSIIFYLKCKGKKRGYIEKQEIGVTDKDGNDVKLANTTYIFGNPEFIDTFTKNDDSTNEEDTRDTEENTE